MNLDTIVKLAYEDYDALLNPNRPEYDYPEDKKVFMAHKYEKPGVVPYAILTGTGALGGALISGEHGLKAGLIGTAIGAGVGLVGAHIALRKQRALATNPALAFSTRSAEWENKELPSIREDEKEYVRNTMYNLGQRDDSEGDPDGDDDDGYPTWSANEYRRAKFNRMSYAARTKLEDRVVNRFRNSSEDDRHDFAFGDTPWRSANVNYYMPIKSDR